MLLEDSWSSGGCGLDGGRGAIEAHQMKIKDVKLNKERSLFRFSLFKWSPVKMNNC